MNKLSCIAMSLLIAPVMGFAQEQIPSDFDAVRIAPLEATSDVPMDPDVLTVTYDPAELKDAPKIEADFATLEKLSHEMGTPEYQKQLEEKVQIPVSTGQADGLAIAEALRPEDLNMFLSKKNKFLGGVVKTLSFLHLKPKAINKVVGLMNDHFFKNAGAFVAANASVDGAKVRTLQFGIAGGFGFNDWIMTQLKRSPYLKNLPERSGFYLMVSGGASLVSKVGPDGKARYSIEPILEIRRSTRIFSPFLFGAIGFQGGFTWENRAEKESIQTAEFYKVSMVNVVKGGQVFGFNMAAAAVMPPGGGAVAGIEGKIYRLRLTPAIFKNFWSTIAQFALRGDGMKCSKILQ